MDKREIIKYILDELINAGAEKAVCTLVDNEIKELNVKSGILNLFRTSFNAEITLTAYIENKKGSISINKYDNDSIAKAVRQTLEFAKSSESDPAHDIAEFQIKSDFATGLQAPDLDKMYYRLDEFVESVKIKYPKTILKDVHFNYTKQTRYFMNSNSVEYKTNSGNYNLFIAFMTKDGDKSSSVNFSEFCSVDLDKPLIECVSINTLLEQSSMQLEPETIPGKFSGDIIVTPDCLEDFTSFITSSISTDSILSGVSVYKDRLNKRITSEKLTIHSKPLSDELSCNYFITNDGYKAENSTIVEKGILRSYQLDLYGANKTGEKRAVNNGNCYIIEPGEKSFEEIVSSIDKGLLVCRLSGGRPAANGDFSGVAKNSFYIENGEIKHAVKETMISGNIKEMFNNITSISNERINNGLQISPWIQFSDITISGK